GRIKLYGASHVERRRKTVLCIGQHERLMALRRKSYHPRADLPACVVANDGVDVCRRGREVRDRQTGGKRARVIERKQVGGSIARLERHHGFLIGGIFENREPFSVARRAQVRPTYRERVGRSTRRIQNKL